MNRPAVTVILILLVVLISGCGPKGAGSDPGPGPTHANSGGSYTQRLLDLDADQQKEFGIKPPKGAKPLFTPGSTEDLIQSLSLFENKENASRLVSYETKPGMPYADLGKINESNGIRYDYQAQYPGGIVMSPKCWGTLFGSNLDAKTVEESSGPNRKFGGGVNTPMNHWTVRCTDQVVLVRGANLKLVPGGNPKTDKLRVEFVNFSTRLESVCPKKGEGQRVVSFKY